MWAAWRRLSSRSLAAAEEASEPTELTELPPAAPAPLPPTRVRCVSRFLDKNRRYIGTSQSKWPPKRTQRTLHRWWRRRLPGRRCRRRRRRSPSSGAAHRRAWRAAAGAPSSRSPRPAHHRAAARRRDSQCSGRRVVSSQTDHVVSQISGMPPPHMTVGWLALAGSSWYGRGCR
jgi:hypothetical protein